MKDREVIALVKKIASTQGVDPDLAVAVAGHETNFDPLKVRFEKNWSYLVSPEKYAGALGISAETETTLQMLSWGTMQVMGSVCRELGFMDQLTALINPELGIIYGCKKLSVLKKRFSDEKDMISAYNAGTPTKVHGQYVNQNYVDDVWARLVRLRFIQQS